MSPSYAACVRHLNAALMHMQNADLVRIINVRKREGYLCSCHKPAAYFLTTAADSDVDAAMAERTRARLGAASVPG